MNTPAISISYVAVFLLIPLHAMYKHAGIRIYNFVGQHNSNLQNNSNVPINKKVAAASRWESKHRLIGILILAMASIVAVYYLQKQHSFNNQAKSCQENTSSKKQARQVPLVHIPLDQ